MEAYKLFALGAATYNLMGAIVGPIIGHEFDMIEWGNTKSKDNTDTTPPAIISPLASLYYVTEV